MVVGGVDQGKSTFSHILAAYAVRLDRTPILIDLDVGQSSVSIPGTISAVPLDKSCLNVEVRARNFLSFSLYLYVIGWFRKLYPISLFLRAQQSQRQYRTL